jgi:hypothetical protein
MGQIFSHGRLICWFWLIIEIVSTNDGYKFPAELFSNNWKIFCRCKSLAWIKTEEFSVINLYLLVVKIIDDLLWKNSCWGNLLGFSDIVNGEKFLRDVDIPTVLQIYKKIPQILSENLLTLQNLIGVKKPSKSFLASYRNLKLNFQTEN